MTITFTPVAPSAVGQPPPHRVWCVFPVGGSHFGRPCCRLHGSVGCTSSLEILLALGGHPQALTLFGGVRLIAWRLRRLSFGECRGIFAKCRARMGCGPAPGPTLKRPCAVFLRLVGRMINSRTFSDLSSKSGVGKLRPHASRCTVLCGLGEPKNPKKQTKKSLSTLALSE